MAEMQREFQAILNIVGTKSDGKGLDALPANNLMVTIAHPGSDVPLAVFMASAKEFKSTKIGYHANGKLVVTD